MQTLEAIKSRRSVKHYDASHQMSDEEKKEIISLAMMSPTAFNLQHWRFLLVEDATLRQEIRKVAMDQSQVTDASMLIVLCADMQAWQKDTKRVWQQADGAVVDFMLPAIDGYYRDKPQVQRDETMRSCGIAAQTLMLSAKALGYESCPMDGFDFDAVAKLINLPEDYVISMFVAIGKGTKEAWPRPGQLPIDEVMFKDTF